jgi:Fe2+ transport system protein FeoA
LNKIWWPDRNGFDISNTMTINQAPIHAKLLVRSFSALDEGDFSDVESRLMHLGFIEGQTVRIMRRALLPQGPLLVEVRGRQVALTFDEAQLVAVEVLP